MSVSIFRFFTVRFSKVVHSDTFQYSDCRGSTTANAVNLNAFSTNQKARMFARFLKLRQGVRSACVPKDPTVTTLKRDYIPLPTPYTEPNEFNDHYGFVEYDQLLVKRKLLTAQNILDGVCPDPNAPDSQDVVASDGGFGTSMVPVATGTQTIVVGSAGATISGTGSGTGGRGTATGSSTAAATSSKNAAGRGGPTYEMWILMNAFLLLFYLIV